MAIEFVPHDYQRYCIERIVNDSAVALFLEPGLGKTAISLAAVYQLKYFRFAINKCLVIAPKTVAESTWCKEVAKWEGINHLRVSQVLGTQSQRLNALSQVADVYVVNRENVQWLVELYGRAWPFDMVIIDESSNFKNHKAKRFKALKMVRNKISKIVELTGTPTPRSLLDLWAQIYLLDGGQRLGRTITAYRDAFFTPGRRNGHIIFDYVLKPGADEQIHSAISDICVSMREQDYLSLPPLVFDEVTVKLDSKAQRDYKRFERDAVLHISEEELLTATCAAALSNKLLQLCNGAVYDEDHNVVEVHNCKVEALLDFIAQLGGEHAIICYNFKHDLDRIQKAFAKAKLDKRVAVYQGKAEGDAWNNGEIDLLLMQPASCAYGLNLQQGGRHLIWFGLTFDAEVFLQTIKRLHRQGQPYPVFIHILVVEGGRDEDAVASVNGKEHAQSNFLDSLKVRVQSIKEAK